MTRLWLLPLEVPIDITPEEARRRAVEELSKAKYAGVPEWARDWLRRVLEWVDAISQLLLHPATGTRGGINWVFLITVVALLALFALVVWKVGLPRLNARRRDATVGADSARPPQEYRSVADTAAAQGDWLVAVRERFRGIVRSLEELTVLDARPARTAWEVARQAGRLVPSAQGQLDQAAQVFNDVLYGDVVATGATYQQLCRWDTEIVAAAGAADLAGDTPEPVPTVGPTR